MLGEAQHVQLSALACVERRLVAGRRARSPTRRARGCMRAEMRYGQRRQSRVQVIDIDPCVDTPLAQRDGRFRCAHAARCNDGRTRNDNERNLCVNALCSLTLQRQTTRLQFTLRTAGSMSAGCATRRNASITNNKSLSESSERNFCVAVIERFFFFFFFRSLAQHVSNVDRYKTIFDLLFY
jgi:hypothetical protein